MIEIKDVEKLASLSRIDISAEEKKEFQKEIGSILDYVGQVQKVAGKDRVHAGKDGEAENVMREDTMPHDSGIYTEAILKQSPHREGNYIKVKKIL